MEVLHEGSGCSERRLKIADLKDLLQLRARSDWFRAKKHGEYQHKGCGDHQMLSLSESKQRRQQQGSGTVNSEARDSGPVLGGTQ